jgi:hypothetical protein
LYHYIPPPPSLVVVVVVVVDCRSALIYAELLGQYTSLFTAALHLRLSSWVALEISCHLLFLWSCRLVQVDPETAGL